MKLNKKKLGVMQGRLLPMHNGHYQSHPENWQKEFELCHKYRFNSIEWIIDDRSYNSNPIKTSQGRSEILRYSKKYNVYIDTLCADILMQKYCNYKFEFREWCNLFKDIIDFSSLLNVKVIVLPLIEKMSLKNEELLLLIVDELIKANDILEKKNIKIALELDLPPVKVKNLITQINSDFIGINYDIGNSASLKFDIEKEFLNYGKYIFEIHVKDRRINKGSCLLGTGDADFTTAVNLIKEYKLDCPIIMQAFRNYYGLEITVLQRDWFEKILNEDFCI